MADEIKISDLTGKLKELALQTDSQKLIGNNNQKLDTAIEFSVFKAYIGNDDEAKKELENDDNAQLKDLLGYKSNASAVSKGSDAEAKEEVAAQKTPMERFKEHIKNGYGTKASYDAVKKEFKDSKYKKDLSEVKKYAKSVVRQRRAMAAIDDAQDKAKNKGEYEVGQRELRSRAKETLHDKWDKGAVNGSNNLISRLTFKNSAMKKYAQGASYALSSKGAVTTKDGDTRTYTQKELQDKLGKNHPYLQMVDDGNGGKVTMLEKAGLITKDGESYDITNLSNLVKQYLGADNTASRQEYDERNERKLLHEKIIGLIEDATGKNLEANLAKDKIVNKVIDDLCGYGIEHKNYREDIANGLYGGALGAGSAGLALLMQGKDIVRGIVKNNNNLDVFIKLDQYTNMGNLTFGDTNLDSLVQNGQASVTQTGDTVHINIEQKYAQPFYHEASKHILQNMGEAALIGGAIGLLTSLTQYGKSEDQVIRTLPGKCDEVKGYNDGKEVYYNMENFNDFQDYLGKAKSMNPLLKEALEMLAASYTDFSSNPPKLNYQNFKDDLNNYAGRGSNLNATELLRGLKEANEKTSEEKLQKRCEDVVDNNGGNNGDEGTVENKDKYYWGSQNREKDKVTETPVPKTDKFEDWGVFASRYIECLQDYDSKIGTVKDGNKEVSNTYARTMMKVMQAITDNDYDFARLQSLTQKAMARNWNELKKEKGFNYDLYKALRGNAQNNTFAVDRQNMPTIIVTNGNNEKIECKPSEPKYTIGRQSGNATIKKANIGSAAIKTTEKGAYQGGLETSDGQTFKTKDETDYETKEKGLIQQGYKKKEVK